MHPRRLIRQVRIRPRLFIAGAAGIAVAVFLPHAIAARTVTRLLIGWNAGAWLYLVLSGWMMTHADHCQIHRRARQQDEGAKTILTLVVTPAQLALVARGAAWRRRLVRRWRVRRGRAAPSGVAAGADRGLSAGPTPPPPRPDRARVR